MKDMREYLRGEKEKYRGMMNEEDEYGQTGAYHYYEGRADAYEDVLETIEEGGKNEQF